MFLTVGATIEEIGLWRPRGCCSEIDYRNSLFDKLEDAFRIAPTKEYGHGRVRADIAFDRKLAIELKLDLNKTGKLQRLKGQLDDYAKAFDNTIVILVGDTERNLVEDLKKKAWEYGIQVIEK